MTVTRDGRRPLLVELQALVDRMRFGSPRRVAQGLDAQRIAMLLAVMNRHAGVSLQEHDVFVNLVGGLEVTETACDLPVALALASSLADKPIAQQMVAFGEIGLTGELRPVAYGEERLREAAKQGFNVGTDSEGQRAANSHRRIARARVHAPRRRAETRTFSGLTPTSENVAEAAPSVKWSALGGSAGAHRADGVLADLQHLELVLAHLDAVACLGQRLELLDQQSVQRLRPVGGQLPSERAIDRANRRAGIDDENARPLRDARACASPWPDRW